MRLPLPNFVSWSHHVFGRFLDACSQGLGWALGSAKRGLVPAKMRKAKRHKRGFLNFDHLEDRLVPAAAFYFGSGDFVSPPRTSAEVCLFWTGTTTTSTWVKYEAFDGTAKGGTDSMTYDYGPSFYEGPPPNYSGIYTFTTALSGGGIPIDVPIFNTTLWSPTRTFTLDLTAVSSGDSIYTGDPTYLNPVTISIAYPDLTGNSIMFSVPKQGDTTTIGNATVNLANGNMTNTVEAAPGLCSCGGGAINLVYNQGTKPEFLTFLNAKHDDPDLVVFKQTLTWDDEAPQAPVVVTGTPISAGLMFALQSAQPVQSSGLHSWTLVTEADAISGGALISSISVSGTATFVTDGPASGAPPGVALGNGWTLEDGGAMNTANNALASIYGSLPSTAAANPLGAMDQLNIGSGGLSYMYGSGGSTYFTGASDTFTATTTIDSLLNPIAEYGTILQSTVGGSTYYTYTDLQQNTKVFNASGQMIRTADASGVGTTYTYSDGYLSNILRSDGTIFTFTYDTYTYEAQTMTGPDGEVDFSHDGSGNLTGIERPDGIRVTFTYNAAGQMTSDQRGASVTSFQYDVSGFLDQLVLPGSGAGNTYTIDTSLGDNVAAALAAGDVTDAVTSEGQARIVDPLGHTTTYTMNAVGNHTQIQTPDTHLQTFAFDTSGHATQAVDQLTGTTTYAYDAVGEVTSAQTPDGAITTYTYDPTFHRVATQTDPLHQVTTFTYDSFGELVSEINPLGEITTYSWSSGSLVTASSPPTLADPGDQSNFVGDNVSLQLAATDSAGAPLLYSSTTLPTGLKLSSTGLVYGTVTSATTTTVLFTVTDGLTPQDQSITWTVNALATAGSLDHFIVSPVAATITMGLPLAFTVTALDASGDVLTGYGGTITLTNSHATFAGSTTLVHGFGSFTATFSATGSQAIDAAASGKTGTNSVMVLSAVTSTATKFLVSVPGGITAGTAFLATVIAVDSSNVPVPSYTGTVHLSSSDAAAALPADATLTNGMGTFLVTLKTATRGSFSTLSATDTPNSLTGTSVGLTVAPGSTTHFSVTSPSGAVTGYAFNITITALDAFGNIATGYAGTVNFSSSDSQFALSPASLTSGVSTFSATLKTAGSQTITATDSSILGSSAPMLVRGLVVSSFTPTPTGFMVGFNKPFVPADLALYNSNTTTVNDVTLVGASSGSIPGSLYIDPSNQSITFTALSGYLTTGTNSAVLPDDSYTVKLISGSGSNGFLDVLGNGLDGMNSGGHANYTIAFSTSFQNDTTPVLGIPDFARGPGGFAISTASESGMTVTITTPSAIPFAANNQVVIAGMTNTSYNGTYTINSVTNSGGTHTFTYTSTSSGLTTDSSGTGLAYETIKVPYPKSFAITSATYSGGTVTIATANTTGFQVGDTVTVSGVSSSGYNGTYSISGVTNSGGTHTFTYSHSSLSSSSGGIAYENIPSTKLNGIPITLYNYANVTDVTFSVAYNTALFTLNGVLTGSHSDATDAAATLTMDSNSGGIATFHYTDSSPVSATPGTPLILGDLSAFIPNTAANKYKADQIMLIGNIVINGVDSRTSRAVAAYTIQVDAYLGDVNADGTITALDKLNDNSVATGSATGFSSYKLLNPEIIGGVSGGSSGINSADVTTIDNYDALLSPPQIPVPPSLSLSSSTTSDVNYLANPGDQNNIVGDSVFVQPAVTENPSPTLTFTYDGLPAGLTYSSSTGLVTGTLTTAATSLVTETVYDGTSTYTMAFNWDVGAAATAGSLDHFVVSPAAYEVPSGGPLNFTVTAVDASGNVRTSYTGPITLTITNGTSTGSTTLTHGVGAFTATFSSTGNQTITASDSTPSGVATITVDTAAGNSVNHLFLSVPSNAVAGVAFPVTVIAQDSSNIVAAGYTGTVHFTSSDGSAVLPADAKLTDGIGTFMVTLKTVNRGSFSTITVTDSTRTIVSTGITTSAAAADHFSVSVPGTAITGTAFNVTVSALDPFGNIDTGYAGAIHFSSSDGQAILPADANLSSGESTFKVTLDSVSNQTITATDNLAVNPIITGTSSAVAARGLVVTSVTPTPTGFTATFNKPLLPADLALYGPNNTRAADVTLTTTSDTVVFSGAAIVAFTYNGKQSNQDLVTFTGSTATFAFNGTNAGSAFNNSSGTAALFQTYLGTIAALSGHVTVTGANGGPYTVLIDTTLGGDKLTVASGSANRVVVSFSYTTGSTTTAFQNYLATLPGLTAGGAVTVNGLTGGPYTVSFGSSVTGGSLLATSSGSANVFAIGSISGTLLVDPSNESVTFKASAANLLQKNKSGNYFDASYTSVVLPDAAYKVTLVSGSGSTGFLDALLAGLDGANNGGHANYTTTFTTSYQRDATPVLGLPEFARGPDSGIAVTTATVTYDSDADDYVVTITTPLENYIVADETVVISGIGNSDYDGTFTVDSASGNQFTYILAFDPGAYDSGGVVVVGNINIRVPNNTAGVPITLYNAANVTDVTFTLTYNPALLTITGTLDGESGVSDATSGTSYLTLLSNSDGVATFEYTDYYSTSATVDAPLILGDLVAFVPISAAALYQATEALHFSSITINGSGATEAVSSDGIHVNTYFADATGDGTITGVEVSGVYTPTGTDAWTVNQVATGAANGYAAFPLVAPVIIGDIYNEGVIDASDGSAIADFVTDPTFVTQIPVPPGTLTFTNWTTPVLTPSVGLLQGITNADLQKTTFIYNSQRQLIATVDSAGLSTEYGYDGAGNIATVTDSNGRITTTSYDAGNRPTLVIDPAGWRTTYTYDYANQGLLLSETDSNGLVTSYAYDAQDRQTEVIEGYGSGLAKSTFYQYDTAGNQTAVVDPFGHTTGYQYDLNNRLTLMTEPVSSGVNRTTQYGYDASGDLTTVTDPLGHVTTTRYDAMDRPTLLIDALGKTTTMVYDADGQLTKTIDPLLRTTTYVYDAAGQPIAVADPRGKLTTTLYDSAGMVTGTIDPLGDRATYVFDSAGRPSADVDPLGDRSTTIYNSAGEVAATVDPLGRTTQFVYDGLGRQIGTIDPLGNHSVMEYNSADEVTATVDPLGRTTQYFYDSHGLETVVVDPLGGRTTTVYNAADEVSYTVDPLNRTTSYFYDASWRLTAVADNLGRSTVSTYDFAGQLVKVVDALLHTTTYAYDLAGRPTEVDDPRSHSTVTAYDADNRVTSVTDWRGYSTLTAYDDDGEATMVTDALTHSTLYSYDTAGRLTQVTDANTNLTTMVYDDAGQMIAVADALGRTTFVYDKAGRQTDVINSDKGRTYTVFDGAGEVVSVHDPDGLVESYQYDADGRLTSQTDFFGAVTKTFYDAAGQVIATVDPLGHRMTMTYDADGRQVATIDALGNRTTSVYDAGGQLVNVIDADNNKTTFAYDAVGNETLQTDALGHSATFAYDAGHEMTASTDRLGRVITFSYDGNGLETGETWYNAGGTVVNDRSTFTYDADGNLLTAANGNGIITMAYDNLDRMTAVNEPVGATLTTTYDNLGNRTALQDGTGVESFSYDVRNRLTTITYTAAGTQVIDIALALNALNELTGVSRYNGMALAARTSYTYDDAGRITGLIDTNGSAANLSHYTYTYDAAGNLQTESLARTTFTAVVTTYTYDADNQLKNDSNTTFSYDATGNRSSTVTGGTTFTYSTTTGNQLQYDGVWTYTYDAEGNETGKVKAGGEHWTYTYDNKNELVEADHYATLTSTCDKSVVYTYDALGNRIAQSYDADGAGGGAAVVTKFVLDGWKAANGHLMGNTNWDVIEVLDGSGSLTSRNIFGDAVDQVFAEMAYSGGTFTPAYTLTDVRGSVRDVVNNSGTVLDSVNYGAFGNILSGETNSANRGMYAWTGRQLDVETGLQYNRARYYDSATGRWISQDPLGFDAGDSNLYRYVNNAPTNHTDPSGKDIVLLMDPTAKVPVFGTVGHPAVLIGNDTDGWQYFSFHGGDPSTTDDNLVKKSFKTLADAKKDAEVNSYSKFIRYKTNKAADDLAKKEALSWDKTRYDLATHNCSIFVYWVTKRAGVRLPTYRVALGYNSNSWFDALDRDAKTNGIVIDQGKWASAPPPAKPNPPTPPPPPNPQGWDEFSMPGTLPMPSKPSGGLFEWLFGR